MPDLTWGSVCDTNLDWKDAAVICRQEHCGIPKAIFGGTNFGEGQGPVWTEEIQCQGNETHLTFCPTSTTQHQNCTHKNDVSIVCSGCTGFRLMNGSDSCSGRVELQWLYREWGTVCDLYWDLRDATALPAAGLWGGCSSARAGLVWTGQWTNQLSLRLIGAGGDCAGRLEVYHRGSWGTVCDDSWDLADSQVVCRQLQCGTALSAPVPQVEVYYNGTWGSVCQNAMTDITAAVICKQLGCGDKGTIRETNSRLSPDPKWLDFVSCRKHDSTLWQCPSFPWGQNDCTDREVANITCSEALHLAGGTTCSGRVELRYEGSWGTVCDDSWDLQDAQVVCRQLGCGDAVSSATEASFGPGSGTIWLDEVNCRGSELHLWDCCHSGLNQSDCRHKEDAGVTCTGVTKLPRQPKQEPGGWTVPAVVFFLLGALVFVLLVLLVGQLIWNRRLRKALAEAEIETMNVYQEIPFKLTVEGAHSAPRRGRFLSDERPSEYDNVEDSKEDRVPGKLLCDELQSEYDDVENNENDPISDVSPIAPGVRSLLATEPSEDETSSVDSTDYDDVRV
ncbi:C163A protein, partial [Atractosteus spatula]|nr:C163A protein [Atractosteus spatula]